MIPLSFAQRRMWFLFRFEGPSVTYNLPVVLRLRGEVDAAALAAAVRDVVVRHEVLRTLVVEDEDGAAFQRVVPEDELVLDVPVREVDPADVQGTVTELVNHRFDLAAEIPLRATIVRGVDGECVFVLLMHHIAGDGASMAPLARDVSLAYEARAAGREPGWEPLPVQYADYTLWQRELLGDESDPGSVLSRQLEYWRAELAGVPQPLRLPTDRPRPKVAGYGGETLEFEVGADTAARVHELARDRGVTVPMVLQAALAVLLARLSGDDDVTIGSPIAGRTDPALADLVGFFVNTWVLRVRLIGDPSFDDVLGQVREKCLAAYDNQDAPFERLVELLNPQRSTAYHPLFQVMFIWQNNTVPEVAQDGPDWTAEPVRTESSMFDLSFTLAEPQGPDRPIRGFLEYAEDLFDRGTADSLAARYVQVLERLVADPSVTAGAVEVLVPGERERLLAEWNDTAVEVGPEPLPRLFERRAAATPDAVALVSGDRALSYRELNERANRMAHWLIERDAGPGSRVAVAAPRSPELVVALLAVLKAGGCYVPVDPDYPVARVDFVVSDCAAALVLGPDELAQDLSDRPADDPEVAAPPSAPAFVIYTSGSTGVPKGVVVTHGSLVNLLGAVQDRFRLTAADRLLAVTTVAFDIAAVELFLPLLAGGRVVMASRDQVREPAELLRLLRRAGISIMQATPSLWQAIVEHDPAALTGLRVLSTGEALPPALAARLCEYAADVTNLYGPSETTIFSTISAVPGTGPVPIGRPVANTRVLVLDRNLRLVPPGVTGELYIAGSGLAQGYHDRPGLTAQRFVADPYGPSGSRMYRTGDLASWTSRGEVFYGGRVDHQVKLRGFRIEPGEIETVVTAHPAVAQAVVVARGEDTAKQLVCYVVPEPGTSASPEDLTAELRRHVAGRLPDFMVPAGFTVLDALPLTANGKLDRSALPDPVFTGAKYQAPRTPQEHALAQVFADVLGLERVGIDDDFFAVGGDSIRSIQVVSKARAEDLVLSPRDVFEHRTVARLVVAAEANARAKDRPVLAELPGGGVGLVPLPPVARLVLDRGGSIDRFAQWVVVNLPAGIDRTRLAAVATALLDRHDMLRARLATDRDGERALRVGPAGVLNADRLLHRVTETWRDDGAWERLASRELDAALDRLAPADGVMVQLVWFDAPAGGRLLVVIHHMVVDAVSWRILLPDLAAAWEKVSAGERPTLPAPVTSVRRWIAALADEAVRPERAAELDYWRAVLEAPDPLLGSRRCEPGVDVAATVERIRVTLPPPVTEALITALPRAFRAGPAEGLLTGLAMAVARWRRDRGTSEGSVLVRAEGHGREEEVIPGADLSRTVGWFTTMFPARLSVAGFDLDEAFAGGPAAGAVIKAVKEQWRSIPDGGIGYGLLRHLNPEAAEVLRDLPLGQIGFNYLGRQTDADPARRAGGADWFPAAGHTEITGARDADMTALAELDVNASITDTAEGPALTAAFAFPTGVLDPAEVRELADLWSAALTGLAAHVAGDGAGGLTPSDVPLVSVSQLELDAIEARNPGLADVWPLTPMQSGLFFHAVLAESSVDPYQIQLVLHLDGPIAPDRLRDAGRRLLARHTNLRVGFGQAAGGEPLQVVVDHAELPWRHVDLRGLPEAERAGRLAELIAEDERTPFELAVPPLLRMMLVSLGDQRADLVLTSHHLLFDGWSLPLLMRDLPMLYATGGDLSALPPVPEFRDYLVWLSRRDPAESAAAWAAELDGVTEPTLLAPHAEQSDTEAGVGTVEVGLSDESARALAERASALRVTLNNAVQACWGVLLGRLTGREDVVFGMTVAGRPPVLDGIGEMVGLFSNTLPARLRHGSGETLAEVLTGLQARQAALFDHHHYPLTEIQQLVGLGPLFDTLVAFESYPVDSAALDEAIAATGVRMRRSAPIEATHYPLTLVAAPEPLRMVVQYQRGLYDRRDVEEIAARFVRVLEQAAADPDVPVGTVDVLSEAERDLLVAGRNRTRAPLPDASLPELFEKAAARHPEAIAVTSDERSLTYGELDLRATRLAAELVGAGVGRGSVVAVALPRSADLVVGLLAVLKAGGAYLPIDPDAPGRRVEYVLADARPRLVLTDGATAEILPETGTAHLCLDESHHTRWLGDTGTWPAPHPGNLAYVSYSARAAGAPVGVGITHRDLVALPAQAGPGERVLLRSWPSSDASARELWPSLTNGAEVVVAPDGPADTAVARCASGSGLAEVVADPALVESLAASGLKLDGIGRVTIDGEVAPAAMARLRECCPETEVVSVFGPPESTSHATLYRVPDEPETADRMPMGVPAPNARAYVLGPGLAPVPTGVAGELYVGGDVLGQGYPGRPGLTASRFVADPFGTGERLFRTGDPVRWTPSGELLPDGPPQGRPRSDPWVEPADVEAVLAAHPLLTRAAVVARELDAGPGGAGGTQLAAHVVPEPGVSVEVAELREFVTRRLPDFDLVPASFAVLRELPLGADGRPDRAALLARSSGEDAFRAPDDPVERVLAGLFSEVLGVPKVGVDDSFFALGGHSLRATRLIGRIRGVLGVEMPIRAVFDSPTVAGLARHVRQGADAEPADPFDVVLPIRTGGDKAPIWCFHPGSGLSWCYFGLAAGLPGRPVYGVQARGFDGVTPPPESIDAMTDDYIEQMTSRQPQGPYHLLGWSLGGVVAHLIATKLRERGHEVGLLALLDSPPRTGAVAYDSRDYQDVMGAGLDKYFGDLHAPDERSSALEIATRIVSGHVAMLGGFVSPVYEGDAVVFTAALGRQERRPSGGWEPFVRGTIEEHELPCTHHEIHLPEFAARIGGVISASMKG